MLHDDRTSTLSDLFTAKQQVPPIHGMNPNQHLLHNRVSFISLMSGDVANEHSTDDDLYKYTTIKDSMNRETNGGQESEDTIVFDQV